MMIKRWVLGSETPSGRGAGLLAAVGVFGQLSAETVSVHSPDLVHFMLISQIARDSAPRLLHGHINSISGASLIFPQQLWCLQVPVEPRATD